jgi:glycosyltransferase involved in cell wall biosynthesis
VIKFLRIGIDGRPLQGKRAGTGRYIFELCRELDKALPYAQFYVYSQVPVETPVSSERWVLRIDQSSAKKYMNSIMWLKLRCGTLCEKDKLDVFWGGATFLPRLSSNVMTVVSVYDLNHKIVPKTMTTAALWAYRLFFSHDINRADIILTISEGTSQRLYKFEGCKAAGVIRPAISKSFRVPSPLEIQNCLNFYNICSPYILSIATREPRKNLELLIRTFLNMKKEGLLPLHKLVLGGDRGWKNKRLTTLIEKETSSNIMSLGYISDDYLPSLYAGADVFVFPSIYEGFGIPVLEARACGTRVVTSDIPELREAGGANAIYITPSEIGIQKGILEALIRKSHEKHQESNMPTWEDGAKILSAALMGELE